MNHNDLNNKDLEVIIKKRQQTETPLVSIVMNCRDGGRYLREAIDSVLVQTYTNWEIIFWDNQSSDNSSEIFNSYSDSRLRYFYAANYTKLGEARNLALSQAQGCFIAFLDCDDLWLPSKLEKQIKLFDKSNVGLVISDTIFFNEKRDIRQLYKANPPPVGSVFRELLSEYFVSMETAIIRRSFLDQMDHWFDERFQVIEEYDFFVRLGYLSDIDCVNEVLAKWRVHPNSWTWTRSELFPAETKLFLAKLMKSIPNFDSSFAKEINSVKAKIAIQEAILAWKKGNAQAGRKILQPLLTNDLFAIIIYLWSLFPFRTYDFINKARVGL
uniref:glycosyltransferase family 2 protein n=1 Tax=Polynucleobacter sp. TaxID=2029855 RepID=UPI0040486D76